MESPKDIKWEPTNNRFVGFFDIMGFKDFVYKNDHEKIIERVKNLGYFKQAVNNIGSPNLRVNELIKVIVVSDSVIISTLNDDKENLNCLFATVNILMTGCLKNGIPIKGGLSVGKFTFDEHNSLYVGKPLIDAAHLESTLEFYGCIIDHNIEAKIEELDSKEHFDKLMVRIKTPTKEGLISYKVLVSLDPNIEMNISKFYSTVSGKARRYVDNSLDVYNSEDMKRVRPKRK